MLAVDNDITDNNLTIHKAQTDAITGRASAKLKKINGLLSFKYIFVYSDLIWNLQELANEQKHEDKFDGVEKTDQAKTQLSENSNSNKEKIQRNSFQMELLKSEIG
jgi:hypothetical protein